MAPAPLERPGARPTPPGGIDMPHPTDRTRLKELDWLEAVWAQMLADGKVA